MARWSPQGAIFYSSPPPEGSWWVGDVVLPLAHEKKSPSCGQGFLSRRGLRCAVLDAELLLDDGKAGSEFVDVLAIPDFAEQFLADGFKVCF